MVLATGYTLRGKPADLFDYFFAQKVDTPVCTPAIGNLKGRTRTINNHAKTLMANYFLGCDSERA